MICVPVLTLSLENALYGWSVFLGLFISMLFLLMLSDFSAWSSPQLQDVKTRSNERIGIYFFMSRKARVGLNLITVF